MPIFTVEIDFSYGETHYVEAESAEEAMDAIQEHKFDLLSPHDVWDYGEVIVSANEKPLNDGEVAEMKLWNPPLIAVTREELDKEFGIPE